MHPHRSDRAALNPQTGLVQSKGKIRIKPPPAATGQEIQRQRQAQADAVKKDAGLESGYLHRTTISKPFGSIRAPRRSSGAILQVEDRKAIRKTEAAARAIRRKRKPGPSRPSIPEDIRVQILARDRYTCRYCGTTIGPLHVDHVVPWIKGGPTVEGNLVTACQRCNLRKGTQMWLPNGWT